MTRAVLLFAEILGLDPGARSAKSPGVGNVSFEKRALGATSTANVCVSPALVDNPATRDALRDGS